MVAARTATPLGHAAAAARAAAATGGGAEAAQGGVGGATLGTGIFTNIINDLKFSQ